MDEQVESTLGYKIARKGHDELIFNDERIAEAIERLVKDGAQVLIDRIPGSPAKVRVRFSYGDPDIDEQVSEKFDTAEYGADESLLKALRYALAYAYCSPDHFDELIEEQQTQERITKQFLELLSEGMPRDVEEVT